MKAHPACVIGEREMFCQKCSNEISPGSRFCTKCGAPVQNVPMQPINKNMNTVPVFEEPKQEAGSKNGIKIAMLCIIIVLLLILMIGGALFFFLNNNDSDSFWGNGKDNREEIFDDDDDDDDDTENDDLEESESETSEEEEVYNGDRKDVDIEIHQFDNSNFPEVTLYASIVDEDGNTIESLDKKDFVIREISSQGDTIDASIEDVYRVLNTDSISINMVLDASGSMSSDNKITQAKNAAKSFINQMDLGHGNRVEIISFDDYVYLQQDFTGQSSLATDAIDNIYLGGATALYDAIYAGLFQTYYETGAKCVIAFTDGMENASSYTYLDVVEMARNTGIPVYIIGIGEEYDAYTYQSLATECSGKYYSANTNDLQSVLEDIYVSIYEAQKDYYVFKYTTTNKELLTEFRDVVLETSESSAISGSYIKSYVPQTDITGAFSASYIDRDYMLEDSSWREVTAYDLQGLSLAELRIARNEIFARHGRQFKDAMLNQWFYSKVWYLNISPKYSPDDFDAHNPDPLSTLELQNVNFIKQYEDNIMNTQDIYPNAASVALSDYDLALSKPVLQKALDQMERYSSTSTLEDNKCLVKEAIEREDVRY